MTTVPPYQDLLWPAVVAMRDLGDSGSIEEITGKVPERANYSEAKQAVLHGDGPGTEIAYRLAWARSYLKGLGLAENSRRGVDVNLAADAGTRRAANMFANRYVG